MNLSSTQRRTLSWLALGLAALAVPPRLRPSFDAFMDDCDGVLGQYLRGQLLVALPVSAVLVVAASRLGGWYLDSRLDVG